MRSISSATALAVLVSSAALIGAAAGPAAADTSKVLPLTSAGDFVVDGVHQKVFISDPHSGKIVATDYAGTVLATVPSLPGVDGLALSADSGQLYAAVPGDDSIVSIETQTITQTARYAIGDGTDPAHLAFAGDKIWFGYGNIDHGDIGSLDISGAEPVITLGQDTDTDWTGAPRLAVSPADPDMIAAASPEVYWFTIGVYDVSSGSAERTARIGGPGESGMTNDLAFTPDGTQLITAEAGQRHRVWRTSDLAEAGSYLTEYHPNAIAIAPDGTVAAGTSSSYNEDIYIFRPGSTSTVREYDLPDTDDTISGGDEVATGGLAWEPGGSRLFVLSGNSQSVYSLRVLTDPTKSVPVLTINAPETATRAKPLAVTGKLTSGLPLPAGTPVNVTRTDLESPNGKSLGTKTTGADGTFSFSDTPPAGGKVTYSASYAGDATHTPASAADSITVSRATPTLTLNKNGNVYSYGTDVTFTAHLGTTYKNRTVEIWANPFGSDKPNTLVKKGTVNSNGNLSVLLDMKRDTAVTAVFAGDARYAQKTAKSTAYAKVRVSTTLSRYYKSATINSHTYRYYRKSTNPLFATTMSYYPGRSQKLTLQAYYNGAWHTTGSQYFKLGTSGKSTIELTGTHQTGYKFRMRSSYINDSSGDNVNYTTYGAWKYFLFTS